MKCLYLVTDPWIPPEKAGTMDHEAEPGVERVRRHLRPSLRRQEPTDQERRKHRFRYIRLTNVASRRGHEANQSSMLVW